MTSRWRCSHRSHHLRLRCLREFVADGHCPKHLHTCFHTCGPSRWIYRSPFALTYPWALSIHKGEDEHHNPLVWLQLPFAGSLQVLYKLGPLRTRVCDLDCEGPDSHQEEK